MAASLIYRTIGEKVSIKDRLEELGYDVLGFEELSIQVQLYDEKRDHQAWEEFLPTSSSGNLFQSRRFLNYHSENKFNDHSLLFFIDQKLVAVCAGELSDGHWTSHRFSSHAGLATLVKEEANFHLNIVGALERYAIDQKWKSVWMRFGPDKILDQSVELLFWALSIYEFKSSSKELSWVFSPRDSNEESLIQSYHDSAKRAVKKAIKSGLVCEESKDYAAFWDILEANLKKRFDTHATHSLQEIEKLRQLCSDEIKLWVVKNKEGQLCAGSVVFNLTQNASHTFYFAQDYDFQQDRPMALLMHQLCLEYGVKQKRFLNFGVITARGSEEINLGLSNFKMHFGASPSIRRSYQKEYL